MTSIDTAPRLLGLIALLGAAAAPGTVLASPRVLLAPVQAANPAMTSVAAAVAEELAHQLEAEVGDGLEVVVPADLPDMPTCSSEVYLASCPQGSEAGCAYVVGLHGHTDWVVTGRVDGDEDRWEVALTFVDTSVPELEPRALTRTVTADDLPDFLALAAHALEAYATGSARAGQDIRGPVATADQGSSLADDFARLALDE